jgi:hypothetical protein
MTTVLPIGWVLRASTVEFAVGCRVLESGVPEFGNLVKISIQHDSVSQREDVHIFGLIYNVQVQDDLAVRQLILSGEIRPEVIKDQRDNRLVPIELSVLVVGYEQQKRIVQGLPPQPPLSLDEIIICEDKDIRTFLKRGDKDHNFDYLRLVLNAAQIPADELLIANLVRATAAHPPEKRRQFLLNAGRELARLLSFDLVRLDGILRRIKPEG